MKPKTLEERVAALERQVTKLEATLAQEPSGDGWLNTVGIFSGDEVMKRIDEAGRKWRESERRKARRKPSKTRRAKS
jgi:hypothetical protein